MVWLKTISNRNPKCASAYLAEHIKGHGLEVYRGPDAPKEYNTVVCFGVRHLDGFPTLNGQCNRFNKRSHLRMFVEAGLNAPIPQVNVEEASDKKTYLARNISHRKGLDIIECHGKAELANAMKQRDFFVEWIPTKTEYRVWVFRNKTLAVYEKQFKGEGEYQGVARNRRFGFKFVSMDMAKLQGLKELSKQAEGAVKAINLDWGAVDVILGKDGKFYVLEVNTAPAIDSMERKSGRLLGREIAEWVNAQ